MNKLLIAYTLLLFILLGCKPEEIKYTVNGKIQGGAGKYIKIIDMTQPGLMPDSIQLDMGSKFTYKKITAQPGDYILYFKNADYIRITPLPNETVAISGSVNNLIQSHKITGSPESLKVSEIIKKHYETLQIIDTLNEYYMKNQRHPALDSIIERIVYIGDSVSAAEKHYLEQYIENNPGTFASYIALSQKIGPNKNLFTLENDLKYFELVDSALYQRFDTIAIVKMLNAYVLRGKMKLKKENTPVATSLLGKAAPEIALPNIYGDTLYLSSLKGKYVLIDFWGSWCRPCRTENKNLRNIYKTYRYKGFEIFQIAVERNKSDWKNTIREDKLYWKYQVSDLDYMKSTTAKEYHVKSMPSNFLIDPQGIVIAQNIYGENLQQKLKEIFTPKPAPAVKDGE